MTPIHSSIFHSLLPVCLKATAAARPSTVKKDKEVEAKARDLASHISAHGNISMEFKRYIAQCFYILLDGGEALAKISGGGGNTFKPFVVIKETSEKKPRLRIITHSGTSGTGNVLEPSGSILAWGLGKSAPATDEEVEQCLSDLTPAQLRTIMTEASFLPIIQPLFEDQTELVEVTEGEVVKAK